MKKELVIATRNKHKVTEIKSILDLLGYADRFELFSLSDIKELDPEFDVEEPAGTYEGNAIIKAITYGNKIDKLVLADDSGLEVDSLNGQPGIYSARYGGDISQEEKNKKLLAELENIEETNRGAKFICVMAIYDPKIQKIRTCRGEYEGMIASEIKGEKGFGFDPIFLDLEQGKTLAELSEEEKNRISHRAKALKEMVEIVKVDFN